jgi:pyrroline-5-carboxylate reductase
MAIHEPVLIIGGGVMGGALATCWRSSMRQVALHVVDPDESKRKTWDKLGANTYPSIGKVDVDIGYVVLAVKPQSFAALVEEYKANKHLSKSLLVSIMAGIPLAQLAALSPQVARVMPNTAITIGESMNVICAPQLSEEKLEQVKELFGHTGHVLVVADESVMHAVTAISGSGPAYLFAFMEALQKAAEAHGLDADTARALVGQTVRGAALLADHSSYDVAGLRLAVTSSGGTTEAALNRLGEAHFDKVIELAVRAAYARSKELAQ